MDGDEHVPNIVDIIYNHPSNTTMSRRSFFPNRYALYNLHFMGYNGGTPKKSGTLLAGYPLSDVC